MPPVAHSALVASILISAIGAVVTCLLVARYGLTSGARGVVAQPPERTAVPARRTASVPLATVRPTQRPAPSHAPATSEAVAARAADAPRRRSPPSPRQSWVRLRRRPRRRARPTSRPW